MRSLLLRHGVAHRCTLHQAALGDSFGVTTIQMSRRSPFRQTGIGPGVEVPLTTLDCLISPYERVDLLKIDTEGAEYKALPSTRPEILRRVRHIEMEFHPSGQPKELFGWLCDCGFSLDAVREDGGGYGTATLSFSEKRLPLAAV